MQQYEVLRLCGLRIDGRKNDEVRTMKHRFGSSSNRSINDHNGINDCKSRSPFSLREESDGWVYFEQGN